MKIHGKVKEKTLLLGMVKQRESRERENGPLSSP